MPLIKATNRITTLIFSTYANYAAITATQGETNRAYIALDTGKVYAWTQSTGYVEVSPTELSPSFNSLSVLGNTTLGDTSSDEVLVNAGPVKLVNATQSSDALEFGSGANLANLYTSSLDTLKTDDNFVADGTITGSNIKQTPFNSVGFGNGALGNVSSAAGNNTAIGINSLANSVGANNTAIGVNALRDNNTGTSNCAVGISALDVNNSGADNSAVGNSALGSNQTGSFNCAFGTNALGANVSSNLNTAFGVNSLLNSGGSSNSAFGTSSGQTVTTGSNNTIIGESADVDTGVRSGCIVLGKSAVSPAVDGTLSLKASNLTTGSNGTGATTYLRVWLNGVEHRIAAVVA